VVAEDEPMIRDNLARRIPAAHGGFVVAGTAHNGVAALELVEELSPDLVVTDIRMPVMDGLALIARCRHNHPQVSAIIVSGYGDFHYARTALRYGVQDYLLKPVENADLSAALSRVWLCLAKADEDFASGPPPDCDARGDLAAQAAGLLKESYRDRISIAELSERFRVNPAYLARAFKESFGVSPSRYAVDLRMAAARKLLEREPGLEVKEVAAGLGYSDQCYFSRAFKRIVGQSPQEYRAARLEAGRAPGA